MLFRNTEPFKVTFTRGLFFTGLESKNKIVGVVQAYVCKTAPKCLESDSVLLTVLAFHFFRHGNFSVLLLLDTFRGMPVKTYPFRITHNDNRVLVFLLPGFHPHLFPDGIRLVLKLQYFSQLRVFF